MTPWGVYVHVPWCRVRCPYCAFHVDPDRGDVPWERFVDAVLARVRARREAFDGSPATVYLGGGTPSRMPGAALARLLDGLVDLATGEVTLEANPEDVDDTWVRAARTAGVTRVSLGVQTLDARHARRLGRAHTPAEAHAAATRVHDAFPTWSADLMFALDRQTEDDVHRDLEAVLAWDVPHVSIYGLTLESGTAYARAADRGVLALPDDEAWRAMYDAVVTALEAAGLRRYEVSNFARPGHEGRHNRGYWTGRPYLGVGPSAHGLAPDGRRWHDVADTAAWLDGAPATWETPTAYEEATDRLVAGLRGVDGLDLDHLAAATGHRPDPAVVARLVAGGLLARDDRGTRLASEGFYVADAVTRTLAEALQPVAPAATRR